jgi:AcrR family transcriptional regulator
MSSPPPADRQNGLRERKKAKTRRTIQEQALRLFAEQGYEATTVEQIAEAAEVSPSTFFRYFPTKEDVVLQDDYDPLLAAALAAQPPDVPILTALRNMFRAAFGLIPGAEQDEILTRSRLQLRIPALRARVMENVFTTMELLSGAIGRRTGRDPGDLMVRTLSGATMGALIPALYAWTESDGERPLADLVDEAMGYLEEGFRF